MNTTNPNALFKRHIYWLTRDEEARLREELALRDMELVSAKGVVCRPLDGVDEISSVAPEVWNQTCARQGSWYRASDKNGLYLVISAFELEGYEDKKAATITESDFDPPASTAHLCSCCLELFQVLGTQHKKKLVAPCPGATIFARLKPDRYLLVEKA